MKFVSTDTADAADAFLAALGKQKRIAVYRKKQRIFSQGDPSASMFYVLAGTVKLTIVSQQGKEAVIAIVRPGELFGESCISLKASIRGHSAIALSTARLITIGREAILQMLRAGGDLPLNLISFIFRRNRQIQEDLASRLMDSAEQNVARLISSFVQLGGKGASVPKISQQTIADMLGITRQRVNVLARRLRLSGPSQDPSRTSISRTAAYREISESRPPDFERRVENKRR